MTSTNGALRISFPAGPGFLRVCRVTAAAYATDIGFDVDQLDDLRLAIAEAATWLLDDEEYGGDVVIALSTRRDDADNAALIVEGHRSVDGLPEHEVDDLVDAILGATLDEHHLDSSSGKRSLRLVLSREKSDS